MGIAERLERIEKLVIIGTKEVLSVKEAALILGISESRVRHLVSDKEIPHYKKGVKTYFKKSELTAWQLETRVPSNAELRSQGVTYAVTNPKF